MLVWERFQPFCACVMVAAMLAALCSPRRSFQLVWELVGLAAILVATPAATAVCCDLWIPCPCLSGLATRLGCLGFAAMMAATCRDWWRPCPCLRGSATPCFGFWRGSLRLPTRCPRLLCWGWEGARTFGSLRCSRLLRWPGACRIRQGQGTRCRVLSAWMIWCRMAPAVPAALPVCAAAFSSSTRSSPQGGRATLGSSLLAGGMDGVVPGARRARPVERLFRGGADRAGGGAGF